jgi:hypothetical protein
MNKAILLILLVILVSALSLGQATKEKTSSAQWEYKFDYSASEKRPMSLETRAGNLLRYNRQVQVWATMSPHMFTSV